MRCALVVVLAGCAASTTVETRIAPMEPRPAHVDEHHHVAPAHPDDPDKLYVEITSDGDHADVLRTSATSALGTVPYAVAVQEGGDVELHVELASLSPAADATACKVKVFVLRLPQHDLLGIADGGARATGKGQTDTCLSTIGTAIVRDRLPKLLQQQKQAKVPTAARPVQLGPFTAAPPIEWTMTPPTTNMRVAQFRVGGDAELVIFYFGDSGAGSDDANIERWVGQFSQPDGSPAQPKIEHPTFAGKPATWVSVSGHYVAAAMPGRAAIDKQDQELLAAVVASPRGPYYFELRGGKATVDANEGKLRALLASLQVR